MTLFELHDRPILDEPVLLVALDGWIDSGSAAANALEAIRATTEEQLVATFDADQLLDFRARRPIMHLVDGVNTGLTWSETTVHALTAPNGTDFLVLSGAEPDHAWGAFSDAVMQIALEFGTRMQVGFGGYPAPVPHTRPVRTSTTASNADVVRGSGFIGGTLEVPAGVEAVIERRFAELGLPAVGLWAQVPHYVANMRYPAAAACLVEGCNEVTGSDFPLGDLAEEIAAARRRIDVLVEGNPQHAAMIQQLERSYDEQTESRIADLPSGDDLAEELQRFLREQED